MSPRIGLTLQKIVETASRNCRYKWNTRSNVSFISANIRGTFTLAIQSCERFTRCTETSWYLRNQTAV